MVTYSAGNVTKYFRKNIFQPVYTNVTTIAQFFLYSTGLTIYWLFRSCSSCNKPCVSLPCANKKNSEKNLYFHTPNESVISCPCITIQDESFQEINHNYEQGKECWGCYTMHHTLFIYRQRKNSKEVYALHSPKNAARAISKSATQMKAELCWKILLPLKKQQVTIALLDNNRRPGSARQSLVPAEPSL